MARFKKWVDKNIGRDKVSEAVQEDCSMMSPFKWTFEETGSSLVLLKLPDLAKL